MLMFLFIFMLFMFFFFVAVLRSEKNFAFKFWEEFRLKYWLTNWKWCKWCNDVNIYDADDLNVNYINVANDVDMTKLRNDKNLLIDFVKSSKLTSDKFNT